jgi:chorismate dehydratase
LISSHGFVVSIVQSPAVLAFNVTLSCPAPLAARVLSLRAAAGRFAPDPDAMLAQNDAALIIGDPALSLRAKVDALEAKVPGSEPCCDGDPNEQPVKDVSTLFVYDVAQQWREMTGLPCVLAIWVARRGAVTPEIVADFQASREYGLERIGVPARPAPRRNPARST